MRNIKWILLLLLTTILIGCSDGESKASSEQEEITIDDEVEEIEQVDSEKYVSELSGYTDELSDQLFLFDEMNTKAVNDPFLMSDESWMMDVVIVLVAMEDTINDIRGIVDVPEQYEEMHDIVLKAMDEYEMFVENYPHAIDNLDVDLMEASADSMEKGTEYINQAHSMLD